mgnify:CR=1 FL=1
MDFNSREDLQRELKKVDDDIAKAEINLTTLRLYRQTIADRLSQVMESKCKIVNVGDFDGSIDPIKACLNSLNENRRCRLHVWYLCSCIID